VDGFECPQVSVTMLSYRLYFRGPDGHIVHVVSFECDGDQEAVELAPQHADGRPMELWQRARMVTAFPAGAARSAGNAS
jgi:hypothetical protein